MLEQNTFKDHMTIHKDLLTGFQIYSNFIIEALAGHVLINLWTSIPLTELHSLEVALQCLLNHVFQELVL